jgi:hypothetical protein
VAKHLNPVQSALQHRAQSANSPPPQVAFVSQRVQRQGPRRDEICGGVRGAVTEFEQLAPGCCPPTTTFQSAAEIWTPTATGGPRSYCSASRNATPPRWPSSAAGTPAHRQLACDCDCEWPLFTGPGGRTPPWHTSPSSPQKFQRHVVTGSGCARSLTAASLIQI